ncbi:calcium-binding protein [Tabrizicola sp.]|uniref:calcium-binding protein n=1 Tax=Tabrizicola sp. TaxID=2005166 RepID=UPI0027364D19|nr:calcium-binding protein [Tabrizicola sp.]MDP3197353.1 calcium-binding protein [Tabrizicola sp.]
MFALLGVFGVLMAGLAADALFSGRPDEQEAEDPYPDEDEAQPEGNLLDDLVGDPTIPTSDDLPDAPEQSLYVKGGQGADLLDGSQSSDEIWGNDGADQINARGGDDWIDAGAGNDMVWAGAGDDSVSGGDGNDTLYGDAGADTLLGGAGADLLAGCEDNDSLSGGAGSDTLIGGEGDDWLSGDEDADWLVGGLGNDTLIGGSGSDEMDGGAGNDVISGVEDGPQESDFLNGQEGNDTLIVGAGDYATGGEGQDVFVLQEWMSESSIANIMDYDPSQDQLVVVYDAEIHPDPVLTIEQNAGGTGQTILLDGAKVAVVNGAPVNLSDIRLVPG